MFKEHLRSKVLELTSRLNPQEQQKTPPTRRRAHFFSSSSIAPARDEDDPAESPNEDSENDSVTESNSLPSVVDGCQVYHAEKLLTNGDFYTGQWYDDAPHGVGKYLWTDGCMYEGEWRQGKTMGRGKFSWPSGATYEGEFKSGFMDGYGTYIGSLGDTYRGNWSMNLKHGHGKKSYANGDYFEGEWFSGFPDGHGRYVWKNGNVYVGQWRNGVIDGKGTLVWANGNRYDGGWENGVPKGNGNFRWADGGLYIGVWGKEPKGVYYPAPSANSPTAREPYGVMDLKDCKVCDADNVSILPSQKTFEWSGGSEEDCSQKQAAWRSSRGSMVSRRRPSLDGLAIENIAPKKFNGHAKTAIGSGCSTEASFWESDGDMSCDPEKGFMIGASKILERAATEKFVVRRYDDDDNEPKGSTGRILQPLKLPAKVGKKQGETISKGHRNYELMLNLQLGIRHAVGKQADPITFDLKASAFDPKDKVWTRFPPEGSKHTPPHQSCDFKWKDYCPLVFRTMRKLFKVDPADYMMSLCGNDALRELSSPGKSGSFFYLTNDDRYMIKTMKKSEVKVLLRMLPAYYNHVRAFENTLVTKFFSLHCVKLTGAAQKKVRFVIMGNLFCSEYVIHRRFDLKGSSHGRTTDKPEEEIDENTTLKDLDLNFIFRLQRSWFQEFRRQVDRDCELLEQERIMDYSLLVGVHFTDVSTVKGEFPTSTNVTPRLSRADRDHILSDPTRWASTKLGISMPSRVEMVVRTGEGESLLIGDPTGEFYDVVLFFGIIDILQDYDISKKLEHAYKSMQYDPTSISAVDPRQYSRRFRDFIYRAFADDC